MSEHLRTVSSPNSGAKLFCSNDISSSHALSACSPPGHDCHLASLHEESFCSSPDVRPPCPAAGQPPPTPDTRWTALAHLIPGISVRPQASPAQRALPGSSPDPAASAAPAILEDQVRALRPCLALHALRFSDGCS